MWKRTWRRNKVCLWKLHQKFALKLPKVNPFSETYVIYLEKNDIYIVFSYFILRSFQACDIHSIHQFDWSNIRWINKETSEYQHLRKITFWKMFDFQWIYVAKLGCRPSLKSLRTFIIIKADMTLCRCTCSS